MALKKERVLHNSSTLLFHLRPPTGPLTGFLQIGHTERLRFNESLLERRVEPQDNKQNTRSILQHFNQFLILSFRMQNQPFVDSKMPIYL